MFRSLIGNIYAFKDGYSILDHYFVQVNCAFGLTQIHVSLHEDSDSGVKLAAQPFFIILDKYYNMISSY